ncbi:MAG: hypothetical protein Q9209_000253 [Squamulea sp. 1 TL-2023]
MTATKIAQDELHRINIILFPRNGNRSVVLHADVDKDMLHPILQKSVLDILELQYTPCTALQIKDKKGRNHTLIGCVDLVWHKTGYHTEHDETFYVVESGSPDIVLRKTGNDDTKAEKQQAQNKAAADKKRDEEQKKREAKEQQQQSQASGQSC